MVISQRKQMFMVEVICSIFLLALAFTAFYQATTSLSLASKTIDRSQAVYHFLQRQALLLKTGKILPSQLVAILQQKGRQQSDKLKKMHPPESNQIKQDKLQQKYSGVKNQAKTQNQVWSQTVDLGFGTMTFTIAKDNTLRQLPLYRLTVKQKGREWWYLCVSK